MLVSSGYKVKHAERDATVYLACTAIINGARSSKQVLATVKGGFWQVMKVRVLHMPDR